MSTISSVYSTSFYPATLFNQYLQAWANIDDHNASYKLFPLMDPCFLDVGETPTVIESLYGTKRFVVLSDDCFDAIVKLNRLIYVSKPDALWVWKHGGVEQLVKAQKKFKTSVMMDIVRQSAIITLDKSGYGFVSPPFASGQKPETFD